jgi:hypothetical protein
MLTLASDDSVPEDIEPAHLADILASLAQAQRGEFASEAQVEMAFRSFDK